MQASLFPSIYLHLYICVCVCVIAFAIIDSGDKEEITGLTEEEMEIKKQMLKVHNY